MRRLHLIELHEQPWFPSFLRDEVTDALQFGLSLFKSYARIAPLLQSAVASSGSGSIADLCSGGGGPWLDLCGKLQRETPTLSICLSDKYPNLGAFQTLSAASENRIEFSPVPVDAMKVPSELPGFRTMFSSFHQFSPKDAQAILQDAVDAGQSIGIFEITRRSPSTVGLMVPWALLPLIVTPWIRPFRWSRLVWTYLIPIIPFVLLFDGVVSCLRTYQPRELRAIVENLTAPEYQWGIGEHFVAPGGMRITHLIGCPRANVSPERFLGEIQLTGSAAYQEFAQSRN
jgi:hypothetical protein